MSTIDMTLIVPGGILETDYMHVVENDQTCSRCRRKIRDDEVPFIAWAADGHFMWIYCNDCDLTASTLDDESPDEDYDDSTFAHHSGEFAETR